jgi:diguanylate cyclase (GGDEF)-like protein/PAS domain S-box-containing protein
VWADRAHLVERPFRGRKGEQLIYRIHFVPERDAQGVVVSVLTISYDVTDQKRMENELGMAAKVFETAGEGIVIMNPEGAVLKVNPAFTRITGYEFADVAGRILFECGSHDDDAKSSYARCQSELRRSGRWLGELRRRRKDGELYIKRLSVSSVRNERGEEVYQIGIFSDISQARFYETQLQHVANHDSLTGLPNRALLARLLDLSIVRARETDRTLAVLFIDLDGFKALNDRFGHQAGDQALVEMGRRLRGNLRDADTVSRIGGDEFVVVLTDLSAQPECEVAATRLLQALSAPIETDGVQVSLSASIGVALYPADADEADNLLRLADEAMYVAKRGGRNQFSLSGNIVPGGARLNSELMRDLRVALDEDRIDAYFQPIIDLATGRAVKAEALVRWRHPTRGVVSPDEFIPFIEETRLIYEIGARVFAKALAVTQKWNACCVDGRPRRISVNRSANEFMAPSGVAAWTTLLDKHHHAGGMLSVEITESLFLDDRPEVLAQLAQLRSAGVTVALDDFGTGFSSLAYLKKFEIDELKIDRSFISDVVDDASDRAIVESVIAMAQKLHLQVIAEGVETDAQAELLRSVGCDYAQGYLYARPMPADEFLAFVTARVCEVVM